MTDNSVKEKKAQTLRGRVVSDKMDKTVVVLVERKYAHSLFRKTLRSTKKYKVHDEHEIAKEGDLVEFYMGRPVSKTKCMYLAHVLKNSSAQ